MTARGDQSPAKQAEAFREPDLSNEVDRKWMLWNALVRQRAVAAYSRSHLYREAAAKDPEYWNTFYVGHGKWSGLGSFEEYLAAHPEPLSIEDLEKALVAAKPVPYCPDPNQPLTRGEKKILRELIRGVIKDNGHLWQALKREIFELGFQSSYSFTSEFHRPVARAMASLGGEEKKQLLTEWKKRYPEKNHEPESFMIEKYTGFILDEIGSRASVASNRTDNW